MRSCRTFGRSSRMSTEAPYDRVEIATKVADRYRTVRARSLRSMLQSRPGAPTILALTGAALPGRSPRRSWWCGQWSSGVRRLRASQHEHTNPVAGGATRPNGDDQKKERKRRSRTTRHPAFAMTKTCRSARVPSQSNPRLKTPDRVPPGQTRCADRPDCEVYRGDPVALSGEH